MAAKEKRLRLNEFLQIQASRDRLVDNPAYQTLRNIVRYSLDFYAVRQTVRMQSIPERGRVGETASAKVRRVEEILESYRADIPDRVYRAITIEVKEAIRLSETEADAAVKQMGLMGALATAGIAAIAYEHEAAKQLTQLEDITRQFRRLNTDGTRELTERLNSWIKTARRTRALFAPLNDQENRETRTKLRVRPLLENLIENMRPLLGSVTIELGDLDQSLRFPAGTVAEWSAIFQNVLINSANAMLDAPKHVIRLWSHGTAARVRILVEDTGLGINLQEADSLFQPFVRKLEISRYRRELGLGGMGMGLAIVRMVANNLNCRARFVQPSAGFATAFELSWGNK
jgi:signal transduction histidine kinase